MSRSAERTSSRQQPATVDVERRLIQLAASDLDEGEVFVSEQEGADDYIDIVQEQGEIVVNKWRNAEDAQLEIPAPADMNADERLDLTLNNASGTGTRVSTCFKYIYETDST